jgi:hypothetical protein
MQTSVDRRLQLVFSGNRAGGFLAAALLAVVCFTLDTRPLRAQEFTLQTITTQGPAFTEVLPEAPQPQIPPPQQHTGLPLAPSTLCHISGVVSDIQGGLIPGAHVIAERAGATEAEAQEATANSVGRFRFSDLIPGAYSITISSPGFETYRILNINLKPGDAYEVPEVALPIARTSSDATVTLTEEQIAEAELNDELHQRVLGILPNYYTSYIWDAAPLNMRQKFKLAIRSATDPVFFATTAITAGVQQANNTYPSYGPGPGGYFTRYAAAYGDALVGRAFTSVLFNTIFHEDPRYFVMTNGSVIRRSWHAISSTFTQRGDDKKFHPAYANFLGSASTALLTSTWHPNTNLGEVVLNDTIYSLGGQAIRNLAREFLYRHLTRHIPTYAKGKPPEEKAEPASTLPDPAPSR